MNSGETQNPKMSLCGREPNSMQVCFLLMAKPLHPDSFKLQESLTK